MRLSPGILSAGGKNQAVSKALIRRPTAILLVADALFCLMWYSIIVAIPF